MTQTTTSRGRLGVADPDLGFDTDDGGTALHSALSTMFTQFSDHLLGRYFTYTLANSASQAVTHNFGLAIAKLKIIMFESGVQLTEAQIVAAYTITQTNTNTISVQNVSGGSKTFLIYIIGYRFNATSADFDAAVSISTTGNIEAAELRADGNDLVLNYDAAGSGADWKATLRRPSSGMTAAGIYTLPAATSTLASQELAETLALKTLTGVVSITLAASATINWAAGSVSVGASIGANTMTLAGASSTVRVPGALSSGTLLTDSNDLILNNDAAGSGADWNGTVRRPSSGMTANAVWTMPAATSNIVGDTIQATMTNKIYDGGTASATNRIYLPKDTKSNLDSLTKTSGMIVWATDLKALFIADGSNYNQIGGGGGAGGSANWNPPTGTGALPDEEFGQQIYRYPDATDVKLTIFIRVPLNYVAGSQINMDIGLYSPSTSNTVKLLATTYLIQKDSLAVSSTANSYASTNAALTNATTANKYRSTVLDLSSSTGTINSVAIAAGDLLRIDLTRDYANDTDTADIRFIPNATAFRFS